MIQSLKTSVTWKAVLFGWAAAIVTGMVLNLTQGIELPFEMPTKTEQNLLIHGGHMNYLYDSFSGSAGRKD